MDVNIRRILAVFPAVVCGLSVSTGALAHDDGGWDSYGSYKKKPIAVEVSPRQPVQVRGLEQGMDGTARIVFFDEIPDGMRLVMQHVSLRSFTVGVGGAVSCRLRVETGTLIPELEVVINLNVVKQPGSEEFIAEGPITLYAEAGDSVIGICRGFDGNNLPVTTQMSGTLVGYLVNVKRHRYGYH